MWRAAEPDADFRPFSPATRTCQTCRAAQTLALAPRATSPSWALPSGATWTSATGRSTRLPQRMPSVACICRRACTLCGAEGNICIMCLQPEHLPGLMRASQREGPVRGQAASYSTQQPDAVSKNAAVGSEGATCHGEARAVSRRRGATHPRDQHVAVRRPRDRPEAPPRGCRASPALLRRAGYSAAALGINGDAHSAAAARCQSLALSVSCSWPASCLLQRWSRRRAPAVRCRAACAASQDAHAVTPTSSRAAAARCSKCGTKCSSAVQREGLFGPRCESA